MSLDNIKSTKHVEDTGTAARAKFSDEVFSRPKAVSNDEGRNQIAWPAQYKLSDWNEEKQNFPHESALPNALESVGSSDYGNLVPEGAKHAGFAIDKSVKCASTLSQWLVKAGIIDRSSFQFRVKSLMTVLEDKGLTGKELTGDLKSEDFVSGNIYVIAATGQLANGRNHIGLAFRSEGEVKIIDNDSSSGKVILRDVDDKFYSKSGTPLYSNIKLYNLNDLS